MDNTTKIAIAAIAFCLSLLIIFIIIVYVSHTSKRLNLRFKKGDLEGEVGIGDDDSPRDVSSKKSTPIQSHSPKVKLPHHSEFSYIESARTRLNHNKLINHRLFSNTIKYLTSTNIDFKLYDEAVSSGFKPHETINCSLVRFKKTIGVRYLKNCFLFYFQKELTKWINNIVTAGKNEPFDCPIVESVYEIFDILNQWENNINTLSTQVEYRFNNVRFHNLPHPFVSKMNLYLEPMIKKLLISIEKIVYNDNTNWFGKSIEILDMIELQFYNIPYVLNSVLIVLNGEISDYLNEHMRRYTADNVEPSIDEYV